MDSVNQQPPVNQNPASTPVVGSAKPKFDLNVMKQKFNDFRLKATDRFLPFYKNLPPATQKMVMGAGILMGIVLLLLILAMLFAPKRQKIVIEPTPTPVGTSVPLPTSPAITSPSRYATDSGVLKIEGDVKTIESQLNQLDIKSSDLNLPDLDWNVNFNQ